MSLKGAISDNDRLLLRSLNPSDTLLRKLRSVDVIKDHVTSIRQRLTRHEKNEELLNALMSVPDRLEDSVMNQFVAHLRSSDQDHVANIFLPKSDSVPMSDEHYETINNKRYAVCQFVNPRDGLVDYLVASGVFSTADRSTVLSKPTLDDMAEETLEVLLRKCDVAFDGFVKALDETGQCHVNSLLTGSGECLPMSEKRRDLLRQNRSSICQFMVPTNGLLNQLVASGAFSDTSRSRVLSRQQVEEMAEEIVDIFLRKSDDAFDKFVTALGDTGQSHVSYLLTKIGTPPMSESHRALLRENRSRVCQFLTPVDDGVLDRLVCSGVFSDGDRSRIRSRPHVEEMAEETIDVLLRKADDAFDKFADALNKTSQCHVAYILTGVGNPPMSDDHIGTVREKLSDLCKFVDVEGGLLNGLIDQNVITFVEAQRIRCASNDSVMARKLIETVLRKRDDAFRVFIEALNNTGQQHASYLLTGEGNCRPIKHGLRSTLLSRQRDRVINMIDSQNTSFMSVLMSKGVFTEYDKQRVCVPSFTDIRRNEMILDLVARKSQSAFFNFISALNETDQTHVVLELIGADIIGKIKSHYDSENCKRDFKSDRKELLQFTRKMFERDGAALETVNKVLSDRDVSISGVREGCMEVTFTCKTVQSMRSLQDLYKSGELEKLFNKALLPEFNSRGLQSLQVHLPEEQFKACQLQFSRWKPMSEEHRDALRSSAKRLLDKLTVSAELLNRLTLCKQRRQAIERAGPHEEQLGKLLDVISRRPESAFAQLLHGLRDTGQGDAANIILSETSCPAQDTEWKLKRPGDVRELLQSEKRQKMSTEGPMLKDVVKANFELLLRCIDPSCELLGNIRAVQVVGDCVSAVNGQVNVNDKNSTLLAALLQAPDELQQSVMDDFVEALRSSGQDHAANIFRQESDKVPMIAEHWNLLMKHRDELCRYLDPENGVIYELVSSGVVRSIEETRIRCKSPLDDMAGELIDTISRKSDDAFEALVEALNDTGQCHVTYILTGRGNCLPLSQASIDNIVSNRHRIVDNIEAKTSDLVSRLVLANVFSLYDEQRVASKYQEPAAAINETILDLIMRKSQSAFTSFIDVLEITNQHRVAETLQDSMKSLSGYSAGAAREDTPACRPSLLSTIKPNETDMVRGVTQLDDIIYVVSRDSSTIRLYSTETYSPLDAAIDVEEMRNAEDIAVCRDERQLYIAADEHCVWRVSVTDRSHRKWLSASTGDAFRYTTLSVTSRRLLVTSRRSRGLRQYGAAGELVRDVLLPNYVHVVSHAVETARDTFVVGYHGTSRPQCPFAVSELDDTGNVLRTFTDVKSPLHLSMDGHGRVLVADFWNKRILLLNSELELERVLVDTNTDIQLRGPRRLCYAELGSRLYVVHSSSEMSQPDVVSVLSL